MKSFKTLLIVLLIISVPITLGVVIYTQSKKKTKSDDTDPDAASDSAASASATASYKEDKINPITDYNSMGINRTYPLTENSHVKSDLVKTCQELLNKKIEGCVAPVSPKYNGKQITKLDTDGYYGPRTSAVVEFLYPDTDGKKITYTMYLELKGGYTSYF